MSATVVAGDSFWRSLRPLWRTGGSAKGGDRQREKKGAESSPTEKGDEKKVVEHAAPRDTFSHTPSSHLRAPRSRTVCGSA